MLTRWAYEQEGGRKRELSGKTQVAFPSVWTTDIRSNFVLLLMAPNMNLSMNGQ